MTGKKFFFIIIIAFAVLFIPQVQAGSILEPGLVSEVSNCGADGEQCSLNAFLRLALSVSQYILGIVGALTLLMFVVGGVMLMISGGSSDKVKRGKDILVGSVVGLAIVFSSYLIIQFTTEKLLGGKFNANLPTETKMEVVNTCKKNGGQCLTAKACKESGGKVNSDKGCETKKDEQCCKKVDGNALCAAINPGYTCVAAEQGTSCLDNPAPSPCYSCTFNVAGCDKACCGWFNEPPQ